MDKKTGKIALFVVVAVAVGILVLPSTVTLFAGQHIWYQKERVPCQKCHADVADEFKSDENHHPPGSTYPISEACVVCHQVEPLYPGEVSKSKEKHAATLVPCDYCHNPEANAFGNDPHKKFIVNASNSSQLPNATEACVACHTHARVQINFTWNKYMTFAFGANESANRNDTETVYYWNATQPFGANGTEKHIVKNYNAYNTTWGNYSPPER